MPPTRAALRLAFCLALSLAAAASHTYSLALPDDPASWKELRGPHFTLYSNAGDKTIRDAATNLETFRAVLGRVTEGLKVSSATPTVVFLFPGAEEFDPYKGDRPPGQRERLAGYFQPAPEANYMALDAGAGEITWRVIYHEYVHQIMNEKEIEGRTRPARAGGSSRGGSR